MMEFKKKVSEMISLWIGEEVAVEWRIDIKGVMTGWCRLQEGTLILPAAEAVACLEGRLSMITAYLSEQAKLKGVREISFHFDLNGTTLTLSIELPLEGARIPSLTHIFRNADWNEREFMELYDIQVVGHPDPRRLFLDKSIDPAAFERLIPYSTFSNGANSKALWEKVMAQNNHTGKEIP
ncbi:MAG: NADH-quinone oxidoreductase subunit C [Steroidobacteraceae bacterium]|nr:NADH-quinone oxidoreductase subunit C [Deltaproteobacteria bacterium]